MSDKKTKFDLDYEQENYQKVHVQPTKAFNLSDMNIDDLENEYLEFSNDELKYKLENENLSSDKISIIEKILSSRK